MYESKSFVRKLLFFLFLIATTVSTSWGEGAAPEQHGEEKQFDAGEFIIDHVLDSHQWHILTTPDGHHVSVHLPVILYSKETGWHLFSSKRLAHGHTYKDFKIIQEGEQEGTIVREQEGGTTTTPLDLSITKNVLEIFVVTLLLFLIFIPVANKYRKNPLKAPSGLQNAMETLILFIRDDVAKASIGENNYHRFTPYLLSVFFFILFANLLGLIPIFPAGANLTGNIAVTLALAFFTFIITNISGNKHYWKEIFNTPGVPLWIKFPVPLMPFVEFIQLFIKPLVLAIRLFANILAGHIVALGFLSLIFIFGSINVVAGYGVAPISLAFAIFLFFLEMLVAFIQAYVFTLLSALYFGMAVPEEE